MGSFFQRVHAGFSGDPTAGVAPLTVTFANSSTGDYSTCAWTFGDGSTSGSCSNPLHTYTAAGVYTVALTVSGPGGTDTLTRADYVDVTEEYRIYLPLVARGAGSGAGAPPNGPGPAHRPATRRR